MFIQNGGKDFTLLLPPSNIKIFEYFVNLFEYKKNNIKVLYYDQSIKYIIEELHIVKKIIFLHSLFSGDNLLFFR